MKQLIMVDEQGKEIKSPYHYLFKTQIKRYNRKNKASKSTVDINSCKTVYIFKSAVLDSVTKKSYSKRFSVVKDPAKADFVVVPKYVIYTIKRNIPCKIFWYKLYTDNVNYYFTDGLGYKKLSMYMEVKPRHKSVIFPCPEYIYSELFAENALITSINKRKIVDDEQFRHLFRIESDISTIEQYLKSEDHALSNLGIELLMSIDWNKYAYDSTRLFINYNNNILRYVNTYQPHMIAIIGARFVNNYDDWYNSSWEKLQYDIDVYSHISVIDMYTKRQQRNTFKDLAARQLSYMSRSLRFYLIKSSDHLIVDIGYKNYSYSFKFTSKDIPKSPRNLDFTNFDAYLSTHPYMFGGMDVYILTLCSIYETLSDATKENLRRNIEVCCNRQGDDAALKDRNITLTITLKN